MFVQKKLYSESRLAQYQENQAGASDEENKLALLPEVDDFTKVWLQLVFSFPLKTSKLNRMRMLFGGYFQKMHVCLI